MITDLMRYILYLLILNWQHKNITKTKINSAIKNRNHENSGHVT